MNNRFSACVLALLLNAACAHAAASFEDAMKQAASDYESRLVQAAEELNAVRRRIAAEKAPLLNEVRAAQERIIAAESEIARLETAQASAQDDRRRQLRELDDVRRTSNYVTTLVHDSVKALADGFAPGEKTLWAEEAEELLRGLEQDPDGAPERTAADALQFMLEHARRGLGGYKAAGPALLGGTNRVLEGTYAFAGPETYFLADNGAAKPAVVRSREGAEIPVAYELPGWKPADADAYFSGKDGSIVVDASGGKALRLKETRGTLLQHIHTGGVVAYVIVVVGLVALLMILQKMRDVARIVLDDPASVQAFLGVVSTGVPGEAERAIDSLKGTTRDLFAMGLRHRHDPKELLEEQLESLLLDLRLRYERRLPLLAVIATAAPLMGLLGTVVGMVKTFALITVFGTGNAAKLSSGISEVLVATELGLVVAIPTLVAHGFLAHRIHKRLSQLERYALQFVTAAECGKLHRDRCRGIPA